MTKAEHGYTVILEFYEMLIKSQRLIFIKLEGSYKNEFPGTVPLSYQ